ncbi:MAG: amino acid permease, partial [Candidatus Omnitrophica bacterium]|nr:amino acid permease [Candidatus Omnitrophota bacterium]
FLISLTLLAEIVAWNLGSNRTVAEAAQGGELPAVFGKMNKNMAPIGASIISGIISTTVIIVYGFIARNAAELFWHVISFSLIVGLFSYLMLFPTFIILRKRDKGIKRPYQIPGPDWFAIFLALMAEAFILIAVIVLVIQPGHDFVRASLPIIAGTILTVIIGEILVRHPRKNS